MNAPLLVVQMQRLGDIIMTFPLLQLLRLRFPAHPLWVVADPKFFQPLSPLVPDIQFFSLEQAASLRGTPFHLVINVSLRESAASLCAELTADQHFGLYMRAAERHIHGFWHLYRASLTCNNRHNRFHWADLHLLDMTQDAAVPLPPSPARLAAGRGRIGLFVGASSAEKHPDATFWGTLARCLLARGYRPFFLGGTAERTLGQEAAHLARMPEANFCGHFSLTELAGVLQSLDIFITPDTGPMHLAVLLGTPTLNLSLGPVHARETGPAQPGHHVLRAGLSCAGCWGCTRRAQQCRLPFTPEGVARVADAVLHAPETLSAHPLRGMQLFRTERTADGLHDMLLLHGAAAAGRASLEVFWQTFFLGLYCPARLPAAQQALTQVRQRHPRLASALHSQLRRLELELTRACRQGTILADNFWQAHAPLIRPLSGFVHMALQNGDWRPAAWRSALDTLGMLHSLCEKAD